MSGKSLHIAAMLTSVSREAGGLFASVRALTRTIVAEGEATKVSVFGVSDGSTKADNAAWAPLSPFAAHRIGPRTISYAPRLAPALNATGADILHLHGIWQYPSLVAFRWGQRTKRPVVVSPHGMLDPWALKNGKWKKRLALALFERANLDRAACLHALTPDELASFRLLNLQNPVAVIANGVDLAGDAPPPRPSKLANEPRRIALFMGRIHPKKGLSETLEAWARAMALRPALRANWVLVVAGWDDGGWLEGLRRQAGALGLNGDVKFVGPVTGAAKEAMLHHAAAFILASHSEGLPMTVLEAWAHGVPVLMTRACNLPVGFVAGAAVEITVEPEAMAVSLVEALESDALPLMGEAGRRLVAAQFSSAVIGQSMKAVYRWLAGRGPRPDCVVMD